MSFQSIGRRTLGCVIVLCALLTPGLAPAQDSGAERRIALVIGNAAYPAGPLNTPANDAGLIAQTLQAAGFDVVGARDLNQDSLRRALRDFLDKAKASGPNTAAFIYLSGYGAQLDGENYFAPIDANIARDVDTPVEAIRVSDFIRPLGELGLKVSVVVLDAARANPFARSGNPLAGGLALVDPDPGMLIAFNAAPGTVAPEAAGPYGPFAEALAEMLREGGLPLSDAFDRARLRVNEATRGAQIPWQASKITVPFALFERAPDAPPPAAPVAQSAALLARPIGEIGAADAYTVALERDTMQGYLDFLAAYPDDVMAGRVRAIIAARREAITWRRSRQLDTPRAYWSYLRRYPRGPHVTDARRRLAALTAPPEPPSSFIVMDYDVPPPPPDEIVYIDRPVLMFDDPSFAFAPPPPAPVIFLPPRPPEFILLPPPPPPIGAYFLPMPMYRPVPAWIRPPANIAPPPNNIIFNNIHNTVVINGATNTATVTNPSGQTSTVGPNSPGGPGGTPGRGAPGGGPAAGVAPVAVIGPALPPSVAKTPPTPASLSPNPLPQGPAGPAGLGGPAGVGGPAGPSGRSNLRPGLAPQGLQPLPGAQPLPQPPGPPKGAPKPGQAALPPATSQPATAPGGQPLPPAGGPIGPGGKPAGIGPGSPGAKPLSPAIASPGPAAAPIPGGPGGAGTKPLGIAPGTPGAKPLSPATASPGPAPSVAPKPPAGPIASTPPSKPSGIATPKPPVGPISPATAPVTATRPGLPERPEHKPPNNNLAPQGPASIAARPPPAAPIAAPAMVPHPAPPPPPPPPMVARPAAPPPPPLPPPVAAAHPAPVAAPAAAAAKPAKPPACPPGKSPAVVNGQPMCR